MAQITPSNDTNWVNDKLPNLKKDEDALEKKNLATFKDIARFGSRYWFSKDALLAWTLAILIIVLATVNVKLGVALVEWSGNFWEAVKNKDLKGFTDGLILFSQTEQN